MAKYVWQIYCQPHCRTQCLQEKRELHGRKQDILRKFGMTIEQYKQMLHDQADVCAICQCKESAKASNQSTIKQLAVDHDHKTGAIRGLLCMNCNKGLGAFSDSIARLEAAVLYLKRSLPISLNEVN